ncbi:MAG: hypothetical protein RI964_1547 [Pseudomonadota bacterium]|jgi:hypothetical protein
MLGSCIYLDSNIFMYAIEGHEQYAARLALLFGQIMDTALPNWRNLRDQLNAEYLAAENWF